jgi:hypothetical protein
MAEDGPFGRGATLGLRLLLSAHYGKSRHGREPFIKFTHKDRNCCRAVIATGTLFWTRRPMVS